MVWPETAFAWIICVFIGIWALGWVLSRGLPRLRSQIVDPALDWFEARLPRSMRPIEHVLVTVLICTMTGLIVSTPNAGPWGFVMSDGGFLAGNAPANLLTAATALLALLLFAANRMKSLEGDTTAGNSYLGESLNAYLPQRSRMGRILGLPIFRTAVVGMFALPLLQPLLKPELAVPIFDAVYEPQLVGLALWCACFGAVGAVLIGNVLGALSNSWVAIWNPNHIRLRIWLDLKQSAAQTLSELNRLTLERVRDAAELWGRGHLTRARELDHEAVTYLRSALDSLSRSITKSDAVNSFRRLMQRSGEAPHGSADEGWRTSFRQSRRRRLAERARHRLEWHAEFTFGFTRSCLTELRANGLRDDVRTWLVRESVQEAAELDSAVCKLIVHSSLRNDDDATRTAASRAFLVPRSHAPDEDGRPSIGWRGIRGEGPAVEKLTVFVYRSLVAALLGSQGRPPAFTPSTAMIATVLEGARRLGHEPTRIFVTRLVVEAIIQRFVREAPEGQDADAAQLANWLRPDARRSVDRHAEPEAGSFGHVAQDCVLQAVVEHSRLDSYAWAALLKLLTPWRVAAALLHRLTDGANSGDVPHIEELAEYSKVLGPFRWARDEQRDQWRDDCVSFLRGLAEMHRVSRDGLNWLFNSLPRPLTMDLCAEFLDLSSDFEFGPLRLADFCRWRAAVGEVGYHSNIPEQTALTDEQLEELRREAPAIRALAQDWVAVDQRAAVELDLVVWQLPGHGPPEPVLITSSGFV